MGRDLGLDAVVEHFTLNVDELDWLRNKSGATRLGFAVQLKFLPFRCRFPKTRIELPADAVAHAANQVGVPTADMALYDFTSRTAKRHRSEIRELTGRHECSVTDQIKLASHLVDEIWHDERRPEQVRAELYRQMRQALSTLDTALPKLPWVTIDGKRKSGAIKFTEPEPQKEPKNLGRLKKAIRKRPRSPGSRHARSVRSPPPGTAASRRCCRPHASACPPGLLRALRVPSQGGSSSPISPQPTNEHRHTESVSPPPAQPRPEQTARNRALFEPKATGGLLVAWSAAR
ncbi:DUF4158 domain-containing protein [Streptomyces olivoreticuli]|uniref:DUF4158 domain-containing protein n=1 Tax=Streptomyces olivoreticuli TaxID=68246 RepID=UPI000E26A1DA|nr:DUF4158 domain-containing protein [Streptomyces olivoreticuli]